ncbi:unnamed protein product, partial [marine sediment metagenome]
IAPSKSQTVEGVVTYHGVAQQNVDITITTEHGQYPFPAATNPTGQYSETVYVYDQCISNNTILVLAEYGGCSNTTTTVQAPGGTTNMPQTDIAPPKSHIVVGAITYHGAGWENVTIQVSTDAGVFPNVTSYAGGVYSAMVDIYECPAGGTINVTASFNGCVNTTGPVLYTGGMTTVNVDIAPPKAHAVTGNVTFHGTLQQGANVTITTGAGTYPASTDALGEYSVDVQIYQCPTDGITVLAEYD